MISWDLFRAKNLKDQLYVEEAGRSYSFVRECRTVYESCGEDNCADEREGNYDNLISRGTANGLRRSQTFSPEEIREFEPHVERIRGIQVPGTG